MKRAVVVAASEAAMKTISMSGFEGHARTRRAEWRCACKCTNWIDRSKCQTCGAAKPRNLQLGRLHQSQKHTKKPVLALCVHTYWGECVASMFREVPTNYDTCRGELAQSQSRVFVYRFGCIDCKSSKQSVYSCTHIYTYMYILLTRGTLTIWLDTAT